MRFPVTVIIERVPLDNRWVSEQWRVAAVEPCAEFASEACVRSELPQPASPALPQATNPTPSTGTRRWRISGFSAELHASEAQGYYLNITAPDPKVFVMCRYAEGEDEHDGPKLRPQLVTVSYDEAARLMDGGEQVEAAPLPSSMLDWMQPFVLANYRPEKPRKVRRNELYERDRGTVAAQFRKRNP
jgi:hypothetical protein